MYHGLATTNNQIHSEEQEAELMKKKNIFDIINAQRHPLLEISRIDELLNKKGGVYVADDIFNAFAEGTPISAIQYIDDNLFKSWKQRGTCIDCTDFRYALDIAELPKTDDKLTIDFILNYCEYAANMIFLLRQRIASGDRTTNIVDAAEENIKKFLAWYNYELKYHPDKEKVLVVSTNVTATSVAENRENQTLAYSVIEYNHYVLRGNIERKKEILLAMGSDLEPRRKELVVLNKRIETSIFFMLNNLNIRHNNRQKGDKHYVEKVAKMQKSTIEKWYDKLYQLMLSAYMLLDGTEIMADVDKLKSDIAGT